MRTLLIDNHDSYTFNLFQLLAVINGAEPLVVRNDEYSWEEVERWAFDNVVLSPGPGHPGRRRDFGICSAALEYATVPLLGVCLGHQGLADAEGGLVAEADEPVHGRLSRVFHDGSELFAGIPQGFAAVRYHSLAVRRVPASLRRTAWSEDGVVMGLADPARPRYGVQFHPESIAAEHGDTLLTNFRNLSWRHASERRAPRPKRPPPPSAARPDAPSAGTPRPAARLEVHLRKAEAMPDAEAVFDALYADASHAFWLDSSLSGATLARFSYMGAFGGPLSRLLTYDVSGQTTTETAPDGTTTTHRSDLLTHLASRLEDLHCDAPGAPFALTGGFVGWLGYELKADLGGRAAQRSALPDAALILADRLLVFDHESGELHLVCVTNAGDAEPARQWFAETSAALARIGPDARRTPLPSPVATVLEVTPGRGRGEYAAAVRDAQQRIRAGESYEVCLTDELRSEVEIDGLTLHRVLRERNPAPHGAFVRFGDISVVSSSPERYLSVDRERTVESKPIKGTAPSSADPAELAASAKDRAENLMIADLARNDLGRVCEVGSVTVPHLMAVETYATVHQLVTTVRGRLRPELEATDAIRASFPPGSMTGAPKERTMEILDELEARPRGVYAGAIGYLALNGTTDLSVAIRTAVVTPGAVAIGAGGAVVAPSDPEAEHDELLLKARAVVEAVALVATGAPDAHTLVREATSTPSSR